VLRDDSRLKGSDFGLQMRDRRCRVMSGCWIRVTDYNTSTNDSGDQYKLYNRMKSEIAPCSACRRPASKSCSNALLILLIFELEHFRISKPIQSAHSDNGSITVKKRNSTYKGTPPAVVNPPSVVPPTVSRSIKLTSSSRGNRSVMAGLCQPY
jgi:hypothetical protein